MQHTATTLRNHRGFTLIELCVGLGICAALAGQAVPAMSKMRQEQKLRAVSETLAGDLRLARSEAARTGDSVFFRVTGKGSQACYVLHTGSKDGCECKDGQARCTKPDSRVIKAEWVGADQVVRLSSNTESMEFQHRQGLVTPTGSIDLSLQNGTAIRQVVAITGRARSCYVAYRIAGFTKCK
jgi:Tfp pilus assembly protein FimT